MNKKSMKRVLAVALAVAFVAPTGLTGQASAAKDGGSRQINEVPVENLKQGGVFRFVQVDICRTSIPAQLRETFLTAAR